MNAAQAGRRVRVRVGPPLAAVVLVIAWGTLCVQACIQEGACAYMVKATRASWCTRPSVIKGANGPCDVTVQRKQPGCTVVIVDVRPRGLYV